MIFVGLDISTSCCGFSLFDDSGNNMRSGYLDLKKIKNEYEKLQKFDKFLDSLKIYRIKDMRFYIEEPLLAHNSTMAHTISKLQRFNGMCCALVYKKFKKQPILVNSSSARKKAGLKIPRKVDTKQFILQHLIDNGIIKEERIEYKRTGKTRDEMFDMADAIVMSLCALNEHKESRKIKIS